MKNSKITAYLLTNMADVEPRIREAMRGGKAELLGAASSSEELRKAFEAQKSDYFIIVYGNTNDSDQDQVDMTFIDGVVNELRAWTPTDVRMLMSFYADGGMTDEDISEFVWELNEECEECEE